MGISVQSTVTKNLINDVTNIVNRQVNTARQTIDINCSAVNIGVIDIGGIEECGVGGTTVSGGSITLNQTGKTNCMINATQYANILNQQLDTIKQDLKTLVTNDLKNSQGWFATAFSIQSSVTINQTTIDNKIDNISINDIQQNCQTSADEYNMGTILICADVVNPNILLNQDAESYALIQCTSTTIISNVFDTTELQRVAQETDNKLASQQAGIGSLFRWLIVIVAIIAVVLIIGLIIYAVAGGFKSEPKKENGNGNGESSKESELQQILMMSEEGGE